MMARASTSSTLYKPQKSTFQFIIFKKSKPIYGKKKNRKKKRKEKEEETNPSFSSLDFKNKPISKAMNKKKKKTKPIVEFHPLHGFLLLLLTFLPVVFRLRGALWRWRTVGSGW
jgi:hypothetical protein